MTFLVWFVRFEGSIFLRTWRPRWDGRTSSPPWVWSGTRGLWRDENPHLGHRVSSQEYCACYYGVKSEESSCDIIELGWICSIAIFFTFCTCLTLIKLLCYSIETVKHINICNLSFGNIIQPSCLRVLFLLFLCCVGWSCCIFLTCRLFALRFRLYARLNLVSITCLLLEWKMLMFLEFPGSWKIENIKITCISYDAVLGKDDWDRTLMNIRLLQ